MIARGGTLGLDCTMALHTTILSLASRTFTIWWYWRSIPTATAPTWPWLRSTRPPWQLVACQSLQQPPFEPHDERFAFACCTEAAFWTFISSARSASTAGPSTSDITSSPCPLLGCGCRTSIATLAARGSLHACLSPDQLKPPIRDFHCRPPSAWHQSPN